MKKSTWKSAIIILACALIYGILAPSPACAVDWVTANQSTVAWDPVTTMDDGKPIPDGTIVKYQTYLSDAGDPEKTNPIDTGIVDVAEKTFTLPAEGKFFAGIQSLRYAEGELAGKSKNISWSDDPLACKDGNTFGLKFYLVPDAAVNMYPKIQ
jgi:hypothetical protein